MSREGRLQESRASIVIVPTTTSYELEPCQEQRAPRKRGGKSGSGVVSQDQTYCPKNYLMSGGHRAAAKDREDQLLQLNRAAIKDLRNANSALANELSRTRLACQEDLDSMRQDLATYASDLKIEQDHAASARQQLATTSAALQHAERHHHCRVKELQKRLRDEHTLRSKVESECESMKGQAAAYKEKLQEATTGQAQAARLAADLEVEQTLHQKAKSHLATLESRLQKETSTREQLWMKSSDLDERVKKLTERNDRLVDDLRDSETAAATANGRVAQLEPQLERVQQRSEELRAELQASKQETSSLSQQVAEMEAAAAMHLGQQAEWERSRKDLDKARHDVERLRRALDRSDVEKRDQQHKATAVKQALQAAERDLQSTQSELAETRQRGDSELTRLGEEYDLTKQAFETLQGQHQSLKEKLIRSKNDNSELREEVDSLSKVKDRQRTLELQLKEAGETREAFAALKAQFISHHDMLEVKEHELVRQDGKVQEMAEMLRGVSQRLSDGGRTWEAEKRSLEGHINRTQHSMREAQATADQLRERVEGLERSKASLGSKLAVAQEEVAHLKAELGDHSSQTAKLRAQLHSIHDAHSKELASKGRIVEDVVGALRNEEAAKLVAQRDAQTARTRMHQLEANLSDTSGARQLAEDAATCTSATLNSLKKKAHAYKKENKTLLTNYDDWLKTLVSQRGHIPASYDDGISNY